MSTNIESNSTKDFLKIVLEDIPLIDVRAPIEFNEGAFPNAVNLPLMNDNERHLVGTCYVQKGSHEAVKLGHDLVSGSVKDERVAAWSSFINKNPNAMLYCFRGGMRSRISQQWIFEKTGKPITRLDGGYKAFRNFMLKELLPENQKSNLLILGGSTGSGKTILLKQLQNAIDLEGLANHRGSSFGGFIKSQPTQINFENNLAAKLIKHRNKEYANLILEDEGKHIGKNYIPDTFLEYFKKGKLVLLEVPLETRVNITHEEYVVQSQKAYSEYFGENLGLTEWANFIKTSLEKLKKKLGADNCKNLLELVDKTIANQKESRSLECHKKWIEILLVNYYDKMYKYQIENSSKEVVFKGDYNEVFEYLKSFK